MPLWLSPTICNAPLLPAVGLHTTLLLHPYPPPPVSKNHLAQEPTPGSAVKFSHHFFYQGSGFFMFLVDVGQLFRCAGHHFMCVTMGPPIRGDPISHSQAHSFVNVVNCGKGEDTHVLVQRAGNFFFSAVRGGPRLCARTNPWFRGQTLLVLGHGGGGGTLDSTRPIHHSC